MHISRYLGWLPNSIYIPLQQTYRRGRAYLHSVSRTPRNRSTTPAIFHCCVQRTGSRWLLRVLTDPVVYDYSGLLHYPYAELSERLKIVNGSRYFPEVPRGSICSALYYSIHDYRSIPRPDGSKAFFVVRDPRDIVVSHFFSTAYSHRLNEKIAARRQQLLALTGDERFLRTLDFMEADGIFEHLDGWSNSNTAESMIVRYEDLTGENAIETFTKLFAFLDLQMPLPALTSLLDKYSFANMRGGGATSSDESQVDPNSHYRSGKPGDWKTELSSAVLGELERRHPGLVARLGY